MENKSLLKIPKQLKVGGHIYKIIRDYHFIQNSNLRAQAAHTLQEIRISEIDHSGVKVNEEAFLHELIHCVSDIFLNGKLQEDDVANLSEGLYSVLKNNKLFS